ncbi:MAG: transposase [Anaerolineae bacterium]|nr:transposase [Anaerolineae bacterium]
MARTRYNIFEEDTPYFLTATVVNWLPLLNAPSVVEILLDSLRFLQQNERLVLYAYVIMENHLHLVASAANLSKEMGNFKSFTARQIIDRYQACGAWHILKQLAFHKESHKADRNHQFWQEGSHPKQILGLEMMHQKVTYIHYNPVRRGWVDEPEHWRLSSARNYAGLKGVLEVQTEW